MSTQTEPWAWPCSPEFPPAPAFLDEDDIDESFEDGGDPDVDFEVSGALRLLQVHLRGIGVGLSV